jgi:hypothetical protein
LDYHRLVKRLIPVLLVLAAAVALFWPVMPWSGPRARLIFDALSFSYPYATFVSRAYRHGELPLWNPYSFSGSQFFGNLQSLMFNPLLSLTAVSGPMTHLRFQVLHLLQLTLGALGYLLWARARGASHAAGVVAALAFLGCGTVVNFFSHHVQLSLFCLLPYPFAAFTLWDRTRRLRWLLLASVALAAWLVTSYPSQLGYYCLVFAGYYVLRRQGALPSGWKLVAAELLLLCVVPLLVSALHLVPGLELLSRVSRHNAATVQDTFNGSVRPTHLATLVLGGLDTVTSRFRTPDRTLRDFSVGLTVIFLVALSLRGRRWLLLLAALVCLDAVLGERSLLMPLWFAISPFTRGSRYATVDFGSLLPFLLLTLAIDGVEELRRRPSLRRLGLALGATAAVWAIACFLARRGWAPHPREAARWTRACFIEPAVTLALVAAAALTCRRHVWPAVACLVVGAAFDAAVDVRENHALLWRDVPAGSFDVQAQAYRHDGETWFDFDHKGRRQHLYPKELSENLATGAWRSDGGYDSMVVPLSIALGSEERLSAVNLNEARFFVVDQVQISARPHEEPFLPGRIAALSAPLPAPLAEAATVQVEMHARLNDLELRVATPAGPTLVVLNEPAAPGWSLQVDGEPAELRTANGAFRAVYVPAGSHSCRLRFRPPLFDLGLWLSLSGLFLAAPALWLSRRAARSWRCSSD